MKPGLYSKPPPNTCLYVGVSSAVNVFILTHGPFWSIWDFPASKGRTTLLGYNGTKRRVSGYPSSQARRLAPPGNSYLLAAAAIAPGQRWSRRVTLSTVRPGGVSGFQVRGSSLRAPKLFLSQPIMWPPDTGYLADDRLKAIYSERPELLTLDEARGADGLCFV